MENQLIHQSATIPSNLTNTIQELSTSLTNLAPKNSQIQLINYVLIATAITGIFIYHYIKNNEDAP